MICIFRLANFIVLLEDWENVWTLNNVLWVMYWSVNEILYVQKDRSTVHMWVIEELIFHNLNYLEITLNATMLSSWFRCKVSNGVWQ